MLATQFCHRQTCLALFQYCHDLAFGKPAFLQGSLHIREAPKFYWLTSTQRGSLRVKEHERYGHHCLDEEDGPARRAPALLGVARQPTAPFVPLSVSASQPGASHDVIRLEVKRDTATVLVSWPVSAAAQCAALLREWLR